ncbi:MAG: ribosome maturation factor RimM [Pseudomonadales bacterium]|nr:ribosome maturation factor RimM [Pseudomonadales bacterium]
MNSPEDSEKVIVGKITAAFGVHGWVRIHSYTEPEENFFEYSSIRLEGTDQKPLPIKIEEWKPHGKGFVAYLKGCDSRTQAELYRGMQFTIPKSALAELEEGDYYWSQLIGLKVQSTAKRLLGRVDSMLETGANDVLVVKACENSVDKKERLIPYLPGTVVQNVDLESVMITVDWDEDF